MCCGGCSRRWAWARSPKPSRSPFRWLAVAGALYLAWLGLQALRQAATSYTNTGESMRKPTTHALRVGVLVALSNPKALIYIVALLPPFVDSSRSVVPQLLVLALVALSIDAAIASVYIFAGSRVAAAMGRPETRRRLDLAVGAVFIIIAMGILAELLRPR